MRDCSELWRLGLKAEGWYRVNPEGNRDEAKVLEVSCNRNGWTTIMDRKNLGADRSKVCMRKETNCVESELNVLNG